MSGKKINFRYTLWEYLTVQFGKNYNMITEKLFLFINLCFFTTWSLRGLIESAIQMIVLVVNSFGSIFGIFRFSSI